MLVPKFILVSQVKKEKAPHHLLMKTNDGALDLELAALCSSLLNSTEMQNTFTLFSVQRFDVNVAWEIHVKMKNNSVSY